MGLFSRKRRGAAASTPRAFHHHPVLGTDLTGVVQFAQPDSSLDESKLLTVIDKLEDVFSMYRAGSELRRWGHGETNDVGADLATVLRRAQHWREASDGAFNPAAGIASRAWDDAHAGGRVPTDQQLERLVAELRQPRFSVEGDSVSRIGDCTIVTLNAIAKGYIADCAAAHVASETGVESVTLTLGGDLVHRGSGSTLVSVQNPMRLYDNEPPLFQLRISNAAMATSGSAARGWNIQGTLYSHVIDPRTARPVSTIASASVVSRTAMDADALATVFSVVSPSSVDRSQAGSLQRSRTAWSRSQGRSTSTTLEKNCVSSRARPSALCCSLRNTVHNY